MAAILWLVTSAIACVCGLSSFEAQSLVKYDQKFTTEEHIRGYGYPVEIHFVTTKDGFILKVYRIPYLASCSKNATRKNPVILWHGLFLNSIDFLLNGRDSLGFMLADDCFDVWLPNNRGNFESLNHTTLSPEDSEFWDFSWHEIGIYDLPAVIDYILENSDFEQLFYVGYSQGTTAFFVYASLFPDDAAAKVKHMQALAGVAFMGHAKSPIFKLSPLTPEAQVLLNVAGQQQLTSPNDIYQYAGRSVCRWSIDNTYNICSSFLFLLGGFDFRHFNSDLLPNITVHDPAGASTKQIFHYAQGHNSGEFRQFDYYSKNKEHYNSTKPPSSYPIESIQVPMVIYFSHKDWFAAAVDVQHFAELTPTSTTYDCLDINHFSFIWAKDVRTIINEPVCKTLNKQLEK